MFRDLVVRVKFWSSLTTGRPLISNPGKYHYFTGIATNKNKKKEIKNTYFFRYNIILARNQFLLTNPNIKAMGQKILASPVAPPRSCLVEALGSIHGNIVGMRQIKRPRTTMAADRSFLVVGIFFKKRNLK